MVTVGIEPPPEASGGVVVLFSGGADSIAVANLVARRVHRIVALHLIGEDEERAKRAQDVACSLDIPIVCLRCQPQADPASCTPSLFMLTAAATQLAADRQLRVLAAGFRKRDWPTSDASSAALAVIELLRRAARLDLAFAPSVWLPLWTPRPAPASAAPNPAR